MPKLNPHFSKLSGQYLFPEIEKRVAAYSQSHPTAQLLNLGIGDITEPLPSSAVAALSTAALEMGVKDSLRGYGPSEGYLFLREAIASSEYAQLGIDPSEIFVSDGAQSDIANFQELFDKDNRIAIPDPTYPVYLDSNVMAGRTKGLLKTGRQGGVVYLPCTEANKFKPQIPRTPVDLIYLCSPSNPTGISIDKKLLKKWVQYAQEHKAVILLDGAYSAFAQDPEIPKSIYEIEGAREVAVEFRTFSKCAGFTGLRCSYTVVPKELKVYDFGAIHSLHALWKRRHDTKFNGVAYPVQRAAAALFTPEGKKEVQELIKKYLDRAALYRSGLERLGYTVYGGHDSPFIWCKIPHKTTSWEFFDHLLHRHQIISIPGSGFGHSGEGFVRFSAFASQDSLNEALTRLKKDKG